MAGYAVIRDGAVVNVIEWDGIAPFALGEGETLAPIGQAMDDPDVAGGCFLPDAPNPSLGG